MKFVCVLVATIIWPGVSNLFGEQSAPSTPVTTFESGEAQTALIELFTSEGCSSCPPADVWLSKLRSNPNLWKQIVPVAFHIDYWNRLGWLDRFSRPEFTDRQRRYAAAWRIDSVYTPNFVVNGREWKNWYGAEMPPLKPDKVGNLRITWNGNGAVAGTFDGVVSGPVKLEVALLGVNLQSDVKRGENSGRKLRHNFVVLSFAKIDMVKAGGRWNGSAPLPTTLSDDRPGALAAWVTENSIPIQATGGWLR